MSAETFSAIPWVATPAATSSDTSIGWSKQSVPYISGGTRLQTLDIWIPATESTSSSAPPPGSVPAIPGPWVIYIHGGAWRDPLVDSSSFAATAQNLLRKASVPGGPKFAGLASLNYNLSPHPLHPTHPAPPADPSQAPDPARTAKHPDHIADVLAALAYLQGSLGVAQDYVLSGHSCGATLAFQVVMDREQWGLGPNAPAAVKPRVILGLNGLYDLVKFLRAPDESHAKLAPLYEAFTRNAFGDEEATWEQVCPGSVTDWDAEWPEAEKVVLVQSKEDTLVPYSQLEAMREGLKTSKAELAESEASGDHNGLWQAGDRLADIIESILKEWK
ncbi:Kynurenine formamidase [Pleurostoma richardsiae]|uniref:Kynurenine formamidase n=1 Tax=Pleurostoma richardsiae TaxID=41990 RepID=A0AA38VZI1_9PEZI|nr:Kynurenine formamidase [Pleurostoma richardsiae]